ncbi:hypothetical protein B0T26DRAFT_870709 [Lasiosphaeria miniovina]|uniref:Uncharacterized protein n=1 Tax=Lasiosphaeria miniovina TaxID=1954250 RepID=A0AA40AVF8_9PEZI|nr:uncharacterized protein B0T26DRAFT_870709 [Lasiosphaeria miniovina]KAK0722694.1 hypothetical protein B0T26DRAFT_870709 [Lasiosphaeria miniovina]
MSGKSTQPAVAACDRTAGSVNIVLIIDDLDKFTRSHEELVGLVKQISYFEGVQVCVSSRPWNVFGDAYQPNPSLKLEDLTKSDILGFVRSSFDSHPGFLDLSAVFPGEAKRLVDSVVNKTARVFLWVSIVVEALLAGLADGDKISDLQATLDRLPDDLLADEKAPHDLKLDVIDFAKINLVMKRRLVSRIKGLLELSEGGNIRYIHHPIALLWGPSGGPVSRPPTVYMKSAVFVFRID